jgi:tetratricopeptide (TPR) repeat protein
VIAAAAARAAELKAVGTDVGDAAGFLADAYELLRDLDAAINCLQQSNDELRAVGDTGHASTSILRQAMLMLERRDTPASVVALIDEAAANTSPYDAESVALLAGCRAILSLRRQEPQRAVELTNQALRAIEGKHAVWLRAELRRCLSEVPRVLGDPHREREMLVEARELYHRKEIRSYDNEIKARLAELDDERSARRPG